MSGRITGETPRNALIAYARALSDWIEQHTRMKET
jgi:hypothetical protein